MFPARKNSFDLKPLLKQRKVQLYLKEQNRVLSSKLLLLYKEKSQPLHASISGWLLEEADVQAPLLFCLRDTSQRVRCLGFSVPCGLLAWSYRQTWRFLWRRSLYFMGCFNLGLFECFKTFSVWTKGNFVNARICNTFAW